MIGWRCRKVSTRNMWHQAAAPGVSGHAGGEAGTELGTELGAELGGLALLSAPRPG